MSQRILASSLGPLSCEVSEIKAVAAAYLATRSKLDAHLTFARDLTVNLNKLT